MAESEEEREDESSSPEAENLVMSCFEDPLIEACATPRQGEQQISSGEALFKKSNKDEAEKPDCSVSEDVSTEEKPILNQQQIRLPESKDEG